MKRTSTAVSLLALLAAACGGSSGSSIEPVEVSATDTVTPTPSSTGPTPTPSLVDEGAQLFFQETFDGNGRTCGTCHPASASFTLTPAFIAALPPDDPLFVAERVPELAGLEEPALMHGARARVDPRERRRLRPAARLSRRAARLQRRPDGAVRVERQHSHARGLRRPRRCAALPENARAR